MHHHASRWALVIALAFAGGLAGCTSDGRGDTTSTEVTGTAPAPVSVPPKPNFRLPDTPAGSQLTWVLASGATATTPDVVAHFSPTFLAAVPADQVIPVLQEMGEVAVLSISEPGADTLVAMLRAGNGTNVQATIDVEPVAPHLIVGLTFAPADPPEAPATWTDVDQRLDSLAASTSMLAAEVADNGSLSIVHDRTPDEPRAIGSAFKLYVLGMLTDRIAGGDLSWDDELTITATNRSFPSGELQNRPEGSTVTVKEAAELMISISDNTATDLLIDAIGRDLVEQLLPAMGMGIPSQDLTLPLLKTREFFVLKWATPVTEREAYVAADVGERRRMLSMLPTELPSIELFDPNTPTAIDEIEWFASATELARAHLWIDSQRGLPGQGPLEEVLAANPGIELDPAVWTRYSFKGGSEPGVVSLSWLLTRADGKRFVVSIVANDTNRPVDELDAASIAAGVVGLLATS